MSIEFSPAFDRVAPSSSRSMGRRPVKEGQIRHGLAARATSERRVSANRRNAKRSTGPRTAAGKRRASRNALKHGLCSTRAVLPGECPATYATFVREIEQELQPRTPIQHTLLPHIVNLMWRLDRLPQAQADMFEQELRKCRGRGRKLTAPQILAERFSDEPTGNGFLLLNRYESSLRSQLNRLMTRYEWLKKHRATMPPDEDELRLERIRRSQRVDAYVDKCARQINAEAAAERAKRTQSKPSQNPPGGSESMKSMGFEPTPPTKRTQRASLDSDAPATGDDAPTATSAHIISPSHEP